MSDIMIFRGETKDDSSRIAAEWFVDRVKEIIVEKDSCSIVLPTGSSPKRFYEILTEDHKKEIDWEKCEILTLDELVGIPLNHPATFYTYLNKELFNKVNIKDENIVALNGNAENLEQEVNSFSSLCREADITILGVGADGHIGMNFPNSNFLSETRVIELPENARPTMEHFPNGERIPTKGITMGVEEILSSKSIMLIVDGESKAKAVEQLLTGEKSEQWPVTALQDHKDINLFISDDAFTEKVLDIF